MDRQASDWVCVAAVATAHGIRGTLKLRCFTERPEDAAAYGPVYDKHGKRLFSLKVIGLSRGGILVEVEGISDRNAAEALRGLELFVPRAALPDLGPDEFYHSDLEGLDVLHADGARLGVVRALANFGAGDILEVMADDGRTMALPFDHETVRLVDLEAGRLVVEPPPELLPERRGSDQRSANRSHGAEAAR
jgi:16S rRNA processing protein RimM